MADYKGHHLHGVRRLPFRPNLSISIAGFSPSLDTATWITLKVGQINFRPTLHESTIGNIAGFLDPCLCSQVPE
jgi:hypothetical protein